MLNVSKLVKKYLTESEEVPDKTVGLMDLLSSKNKYEYMCSRALWDVLHAAARKNNAYKLTTKLGRESLMHNWINTLKTKEPYIKYINSDEIKKTFIKYGILNPAALATQIINNLDEFKDAELNSWGDMSKNISRPSGISTTKDDKIREKGKMLYNSGLHGVPRSEINNILLNSDERLVLVRTKFKGEAEPLLYGFKGSLDGSNPDVWKLKYAYAYQEGCNYYSVRPILWETVKDDPERQECTVDFEEDKDII